VSRPVGRVLCARLRGATVIHLGLPLPTASCGLPASIGRAALKHSRREPLVPLLTLLRVGFTEPPQSPAALVVSYTTVSPLPSRGAKAVCFLWHYPAGHPGSALPTTLPCGARTFLAGLVPGATARPTHPGIRIRREQLRRAPAIPATGSRARNQPETLHERPLSRTGGVRATHTDDSGRREPSPPLEESPPEANSDAKDR
jgi:hypothetical protein